MALSSIDNTRQKINERMGKVKHKLIIMSGKGGVGKSAVAVNLCYSLALSGKRVGLLDVDIHGPSIGKMMGIEGKPLTGIQNGIIEPLKKDNIEVVTMASLLPDPTLPVIWRGPLKMKAIAQFLGDINWGELDYLVVDSPPGTGDEPLSVIQLLGKLDGSIIVTTPQDVSLLDASKTVKFSRELKVPVIGVIENMSGFICPECGAKIDIFKSGGGRKLAEKMEIPFLGEVPLDPSIVEASDSGRPFVYDFKESEAGKSFMEIVKGIVEKVEGE